MILVTDIGNTNIVIGCVDKNEICFKERISTNHNATELEYAVTIKTALELHGVTSDMIDGAIISSVVPSITNTFSGAIEKYCRVKSLVVGPGIKTGLSILIDNPAQLGSDLVVDAVAGINCYPVPQIIIDMGTATTFSVVDENSKFLGGAITTGMGVSLEVLANSTSLLPKIAFETPKKAIGTNTIDSIKSGIIYGNASAIDGMVERLENEIGKKCTVIATGGLVGAVAPLCKTKIIVDDDLMLKGLMFIYNKNL